MNYGRMQGSAEIIVDFGRDLRAIYEHRLYAPEFESFDEFCAGSFYRLTGPYNQESYIWIARHYEISEVRGKLLGVELLKAIGVTTGPYRAELLDLAQNQSLDRVKKARDQALACESEEAGLAAIRAVLLGQEESAPKPPDPDPEAKDDFVEKMVSKVEKGSTAAVKGAEGLVGLLDSGVLLPQDTLTDLDELFTATIDSLIEVRSRLRGENEGDGGPTGEQGGTPGGGTGDQGSTPGRRKKNRRAQKRESGPGVRRDPDDEAAPVTKAPVTETPATATPATAAPVTETSVTESSVIAVSDSLIEEEPPPFQAPPRPFVDPQGEAVMAVHAYRSTVQDLTRAERLSFRIFSMAAILARSWMSGSTAAGRCTRSPTTTCSTWPANRSTTPGSS